MSGVFSPLIPQEKWRQPCTAHCTASALYSRQPCAAQSGVVGVHQEFVVQRGFHRYELAANKSTVAVGVLRNEYLY